MILEQQKAYNIFFKKLYMWHILKVVGKKFNLFY